MPARMAMMLMTTRSSMSVNAARRLDFFMHAESRWLVTDALPSNSVLGICAADAPADKFPSVREYERSNHQLAASLPETGVPHSPAVRGNAFVFSPFAFIGKERRGGGIARAHTRRTLRL